MLKVDRFIVNNNLWKTSAPRATQDESMASQRLSQMMDEYTGPIGFYAYLAHRSKTAPVLLRRNLSYRRAMFEAERSRLNGNVVATGAPRAEAPRETDGAECDRCERTTRDGEAPADGAHGAGGGNVAGWASGKRAPDCDRDAASRRSIHAAKRTAVVFRLRYQEGQQESVHRLSELRCPWCDMTCGELDSLVWHLQASHDRFSYAPDKSLAIPEIYINVKASSTTTMLHKSLAPHADFCFLSPRRGGAETGSSFSELLRCEETASGADDSISKKRKKGSDGSDVGGKEGTAKGKQAAMAPKKGKKGKTVLEKKSLAERHLFRSQTCLPIDVNAEMDMDYDSDDDIDDEWQQVESERLIDEFDDVTLKEKAFMKLWNRFVHRHAILADFQIANACETFARNYAPQLLQQGLRDELLFHMFALWDFNLLGHSQIASIIAIVDQRRHEDKPPGSSQ